METSISYNLGVNPGIVFIFYMIKKAPDKDEGNLMFSQRNNPYCELLQISESKDI